MKYEIEIPRHTARLNQLMGRNKYAIASLKKRDRDIVAIVARMEGIPFATTKRRVSLHVRLGPRQRKGDADCPWHKSLLDALVQAGMLKDDSLKWCELGEVTYERAKVPSMRVTLEDVN
jgi:Holliday junction resolvase RusA-like endonuclease